MTRDEQKARTQATDRGAPACQKVLECGGKCIREPGHRGDHICRGDDYERIPEGIRVVPGSCPA